MQQPPPFRAVAAFTCDSVRAFSEAFLPHAAELQEDIPNYTDIEPVIQVSHVSELRVSLVANAETVGKLAWLRIEVAAGQLRPHPVEA